MMPEKKHELICVPLTGELLSTMHSVHQVYACGASWNVSVAALLHLLATPPALQTPFAHLLGLCPG